MAARLKTKPGTDPIVALKEILAAFAHAGAIQLWDAFDDEANRIAGGMPIDAAKGVARHAAAFSFGRVAAACSTIAMTAARRAPVSG